jgi:predicted type IV restriction endonuclease
MDRLKSAVDKILGRLPNARGRGEEATKQSLVLPLLDALGYDIWNPAEVCPEYEADFAIRKYGQKEKVDLAVFLQDVPRIYFEVKSVDAALDGHEGQLSRYFNATTTVSLAVLTNGIEYRFYTDTAEANVMDPRPFHTARFDALDQGLEVLARFQKSVFSPEAIREYARELNYTARIVDFLRDKLDLRDRDPSEDLVRWILASASIYDRRVTVGVVENFSPIVKNALQVVLRDVVRRSLAAVDKEVSAPRLPAAIPEPEQEIAPTPPTEAALEIDIRNRIVTTDEELEAFAIIKEQFENSVLASAAIFDASARKEVPLQLAYKDTTGYLAIYFNKPGWWAMRLVLEAKTKWIGFNLNPETATPLLPPGLNRLDPSPWAEFRIQITGPADLHALNRLVLASFRKVIDDRAQKSGQVSNGEDQSH